MRNLKIATAIASVLGSGAAMAAAIPYGGPFNATVFLSGSSAAQTAVELQLNTSCAATTLTKYINGTNFSAYTCTISDAQFGLANGKTILMYYRQAGGSVWGPGPIAKNVAVQRLVQPTSANCGATQTIYPATNTCTVTGFCLVTDSATAGLTPQVPDWGFADVETARFSGENWVDATSGATALGAAPPTKAQLTAIAGRTSTVYGQVFSILLNSTGPAAAHITNNTLTKQDITSILSGNYVDWSQVPNVARTGFLGAGGIILCRRDAGSGTQALASIVFNGTSCSNSSYGFPAPNTTGPASAGPVIQNNSTGDMFACVQNNPGAIGIAVIDPTRTQVTTGNVRIVGFDGVAADKANAANGSYPFWAELISVKNTTLAAGSIGNAFVDSLVGTLRDVAQVAAGPSIIGLPTYNTPTLPLSATTPVALGSTSGTACNQVQSFN